MHSNMNVKSHIHCFISYVNTECEIPHSLFYFLYKHGAPLVSLEIEQIMCNISYRYIKIQLSNHIAYLKNISYNYKLKNNNYFIIKCKVMYKVYQNTIFFKLKSKHNLVFKLRFQYFS